MKCENCDGKGMEYYYAEISRDGTNVTIAQRERICHRCNGSGVRLETNADRIRAMTDEELAKFIEDTGTAGCPNPARSCRASCRDCIMDWLQQTAEGDEK